jgi:hypothetical protein
MAYQIGFVDDANSAWAHYNFLAALNTFATANGWETLRYDDASVERELILKGVGYSGSEEIFLGVKTYQSETADYYNLAVAAFTGFVAGNAFEAQPGAILSGVPAHNRRIDYWLTVSPQRIACALKVGTPVYESFYVGKMFPYARPSQYPYPMICAGMLNGVPGTRFSETTHSMPYKGNRANLRMRFNDGAWKQPEAYPWDNSFITTARQLRDTNGHWPLLPVELSDATSGIFGVLEGVSMVTGFDNIVENVITIDGVDHVVVQDVGRTGFNDYYALAMK